MSLEQVAVAELRQGEKLLWTGTPDPARLARQELVQVVAGVLAFGFGVFWFTGLSSFWGHGFGRHAGGGFDYGLLAFAGFGLIPVIIGIKSFAAPFIAARKAGSMVYMITNTRVAIVTGGRRRSVESFGAADLGDLRRTDLPDGRGDLVFGERTVGSGDGARTVKIGFFGIPDVRAIEKLMLDTFKKADP
jgi:hypothetical protein